MRLGVTGKVIDDNDQVIGEYFLNPKIPSFGMSVFKRSLVTGEELRYTRYSLKGRLNDGRTFTVIEDVATGVINGKAWKEKTGLPISIISNLQFKNKRNR